jgi:hypothetical protein
LPAALWFDIFLDSSADFQRTTRRYIQEHMNSS